MQYCYIYVLNKSIGFKLSYSSIFYLKNWWRRSQIKVKTFEHWFLWRFVAMEGGKDFVTYTLKMFTLKQSLTFLQPKNTVIILIGNLFAQQFIRTEQLLNISCTIFDYYDRIQYHYWGQIFDNITQISKGVEYVISLWMLNWMGIFYNQYSGFHCIILSKPNYIHLLFPLL